MGYSLCSSSRSSRCSSSRSRGRRPRLPLGLRRWRSSHMGNRGMSRCGSSSLATYSFALRSSTRRSRRRSRSRSRVPPPPLCLCLCLCISISIRNGRLRYGRLCNLAPWHDRRRSRSRCSRRRSPPSLVVRHGDDRMFPTKATRKSKAKSHAPPVTRYISAFHINGLSILMHDRRKNGKSKSQ